MIDKQCIYKRREMEMSHFRFVLILVSLSCATACSGAPDEGKELAKAYFAAEWLQCGQSWANKTLNTIAGSQFDYYTQITEPQLVSQVSPLSDGEKINGWELNAHYFLTCKLSRVSLDKAGITGHNFWGDWTIHDSTNKDAPCGLDHGTQIYITKRHGKVTYFLNDNFSSGGFAEINDRNKSISMPSSAPKTCEELPKGYDEIPKL